ncbi:CotH kinase family protein [Anatilimnocola aggregata]|nr:CotH kinase family protein [Anatilimnocola aggregata]
MFRMFAPGGPGGFGPPANSAASLLALPAVQQELSFTDQQKKELADTSAAQQKALQEGMAAFNPQQLADLSDEERTRRMAESRAKLEVANKEAEAAVLKILLPEQTKRFAQLQIQRDGAAAFAKPENVKLLDLTEKQLTKLAEVQARSFAGMGPAIVSPQATADMLALLTTQQQAKWKELAGRDFTFPVAQGGGGMGRGSGGFGPGGFGPPGGGGPGGQERKLVDRFDKNDDGWLNNDERKLAREEAKSQPRRGGPGGGPPGFGPPGMPRREPGKPGPKVDPKDVKPIADAPLYAPDVLRTLFLEFENPDWEQELENFHGTDVEVPATLTVDGKQYSNIGVHFRGMSSFGMIPAGSKRSLNLSLDFVDENQRLYGYKTLNLLNANDDPTFLHTVLFSHISRQYIPAPKANLVKVVINGESWGLYVNAQQFDKVFLAENYPVSKGTRWKVSGSPGGGGSLSYLGDKVSAYESRYEMKSSDGEKAWKALIHLCKTLNETPPEQLEQALAPILDIDGALWFLALDNALINSDGYWIRGSDYSLFRDANGKFHVIAHDMNEVLQPAMGPGMGGPGMGGPGGRIGPGGPPGMGGGANSSGYRIDPLVGLYDTSKPLRSKLLAVPKFREKYLQNVRTIAQDWLDWKRLGPVVKEYAALIESEVAADTRKLSSMADFQSAVLQDLSSGHGPPGGHRSSLELFARERSKFLLGHSSIVELAQP